MNVSVQAARELVEASLVAAGFVRADAIVISGHLIDSELRGLAFGGLARALTVIEMRKAARGSERPITLLRETAVSAAFAGGEQVGYLVGQRVTEVAIAKARTSGLAVVGAHRTRYTGMFAYYLERIAEAGFAGMVAGSGGPIVAPEGGSQGRYSTNPIAFGFPSLSTPVIWDIGTAAVMLGDVVLKRRLGQLLDPGLAFDAQGEPTIDPGAALDGGAFKVWGGHKGSGLAMVVQLLGMMSGASVMPVGGVDCGFFMVVIDPGLLTDPHTFRHKVSDYAESLRTTRPINPSRPVRVPFERSAAERARRLQDDRIEVADEVYAALAAIRKAGPTLQA